MKGHPDREDCLEGKAMFKKFIFTYNILGPIYLNFSILVHGRLRN